MSILENEPELFAYAGGELQRSLSDRVRTGDRVNESMGKLYLQKARLADDRQGCKIDTKITNERSGLERKGLAGRQNCHNLEQASTDRSCSYFDGNIEDMEQGGEIKYSHGRKTPDNVSELKATVEALQNSISYLEDENTSLHRELRDKRVATCMNASEMCPNKTVVVYERPWEYTVTSNPHSHILPETNCDSTMARRGCEINSHSKMGELKMNDQTVDVELESDASTSGATNDYSNRDNLRVASENNKDMLLLRGQKMHSENMANQDGESNGDSDKMSLLRKLSEAEKQRKSCLRDMRRLAQKYEESREQLNVQNAALERALQEKHALFLSLKKRREENESLSSMLRETKQEKQKLQDAFQRAREENDGGNRAAQASREECQHLTEAAYRLIREKQLLEEMEAQLREDLEDCRHRLHQSDDDILDLREKEQQLIAEKKELLAKMVTEREENEQLEAAMMEKERANHCARKELVELRQRCNATEQKLQAELEEARLGQSMAEKSAQGMREELRATGYLVQALKEEKQLLRREVAETNRARVQAEAEAKRSREALLQEEELARDALREKEMMELELQQLRADYLHLSDRIAIRLGEMHIEGQLEGNENPPADDVGDGDGVGNGK
uniref:Coiled-coil domain-containing protein 110-like n=1 Tax=Petromyzon marinus TaxID=7757 RepID=A0AAJ7SU58_PETMA|nr:coiled-coil domain-containing protein 110-like [Petromyzon marinus]XP_032805661.1 coiled-coil domain-containing protein 110-like [Petromyzon marinus]XP_032805662.1 coiled-coil domain-containing protein 110-like [Petromyzon marinus]